MSTMAELAMEIAKWEKEATLCVAEAKRSAQLAECHLKINANYLQVAANMARLEADALRKVAELRALL